MARFADFRYPAQRDHQATVIDLKSPAANHEI